MDNLNNKKWWDDNTMSYVDWDKDEKIRSEDSPAKIKEVNKNYILNNQFLAKFFTDFHKEKKINKLKFKKALDIGCGWGTSSILLSELFNDVDAIDISSTSISKAKLNINLNKKGNIKLYEFDAEKLDLKKTYDFIYSWGVIHHSANPSKIYNNIFHALKEEGRFMIMVYNKNSLRYWFKGAYELFIKLKIFKGYNFESVQKFFTDGYYQKHYSPMELIKELKSIGFKDLKYELTHMEKKYTPFFDKKTIGDNFLKKNFGWLLVVTGKK